MKNKILKISLIVILVLVAICLLFKNRSVTAPIDTPKPITKDSITGCYIARIGKDVYTLAIHEGSHGIVRGKLAYKNFQKDSSRGTFAGTWNDPILLGEYEFDSEGMHSVRQVIFKKEGDSFIPGFGPVTVRGNREVFADMTAITYDSKLAFTYSDTCDNRISYTDPGGAFSFSYNPNFPITEGDKKLVKNWRSNSISDGVLLAVLSIPKSYMQNTNFSEATFTVGRSSDPSAIKNCLVPENAEKPSIGSTKIDGMPFTKIATSEGAAGNFYETTSYRTIVDGDCYALEYTIHSTNIGAYSPEQGIKEFNKSKIIEEMEKVLGTFDFLMSSD